MMPQSSGVYDTIRGDVYNEHGSREHRVNEEKVCKRKDGGGDKRKYASCKARFQDRPQLLIGVTHLTGSQPTNDDKARMAAMLQADLDHVFSPRTSA